MCTAFRRSTIAILLSPSGMEVGGGSSEQVRLRQGLSGFIPVACFRSTSEDNFVFRPAVNSCPLRTKRYTAKTSNIPRDGLTCSSQLLTQERRHYEKETSEMSIETIRRS